MSDTSIAIICALFCTGCAAAFAAIGGWGLVAAVPFASSAMVSAEGARRLWR